MSGGQNTDYGDPAFFAPNNFLWLRDAIFTVKSNCTFNGLNGWMAQPFGSSGTITLSLYRFRPISNAPSPIGTLVASTTLTCANTNNMYYYTIAAPATPFTAQAGDIFVLFASSPSSANCYGQGSIEFINN